MSALQKKLTALVEPLLASLGLELWGLEFLPAKRSILRIYIEKIVDPALEAAAPAPSGEADAPEARPSTPQDANLKDAGPKDAGPKDAGIDECAHAARVISLTFDVEDPIDGSYFMEVSTPGLERVFFTPAQLAAYAGQPVDLSLHSAQESHPGRKKFVGRVTALDAEQGRFSLELLNPADFTPEEAVPLEFHWDNVKKARLIYVAPEKPNAPKPKQARQKKKAAAHDAAPKE